METATNLPEAAEKSSFHTFVFIQKSLRCLGKQGESYDLVAAPFCVRQLAQTIGVAKVFTAQKSSENTPTEIQINISNKQDPICIAVL